MPWLETADSWSLRSRRDVDIWLAEVTTATRCNWQQLAATGGEIAALAPESLTRPITLDCTEPSALNSPASGPMGLGPSFCPFQALSTSPPAVHLISMFCYSWHFPWLLLSCNHLCKSARRCKSTFIFSPRVIPPSVYGRTI